MRRSALLALVMVPALLFTACTRGLVGGTQPPPPQNPGGSLKTSINHVVVTFQENRSFDQYFGKLNDYRVANGQPADVDGLPTPLPTNPNFENTGTIQSFKFRSVCHENVSPFWNESHEQVNRFQPLSTTSFPMDGFVWTAAKMARNNGWFDVDGLRAMGYYDQSHLPYYYFMATQFATSDRWFSPLMSRTQPNRLYSYAATSVGHVYPTGALLSNTMTIFHLLESKGITWKVYVVDYHADPALRLTYMRNFEPFYTQHADKFVPADPDYFNDLANGTLPQVAFIEPGSSASGLDEHPLNNITKGAAWIARLVNALMTSQYWKDSVFIHTYDEGGGVYDHVPPQPAVHPDGIAPVDLKPGDYVDDFTRTGFRVPLIVISPFAKKGYVSHTVADFTAILKFLETRFDLPNLTQRDKAQMDMTEFFDFTNPPWMTPPTPPDQPIVETQDPNAPINCSFPALR